MEDCLIYLSRIDLAGMVCLICLSRIDQTGKGAGLIILLRKIRQTTKKLDGVGPVDNRPSSNKLKNFVKKKKNI